MGRTPGGSSHSILTDAGGHVSITDATQVVRTYYGPADLSRLSGERDDNFRVRTGAHPDWMLKIAHPREDPGVTAFQSAILEHLEDCAVEVPELIRTRSGQAHEWITDGPASGRALRMTTFLAGSALRECVVGPTLAAALGRTIAELDAALSTLAHPGVQVELMWDLQQAHRTRELVAGNPDIDRDGILRASLDRFVADGLPRLNLLPKQVIHNDFNPDNVLIAQDQAIGVLDFGDAVIAPRVVDLAVGAAYHVDPAPGAEVLGTALELIAGYHRHTPLTVDEIGLLHELIVARVAVAISIASWRAARFPGNNDYILRNTATAWKRLEALSDLDPAATTAQIKRKCESQ